MLFNFIGGFIIPWIFGIYLALKSPKTLLLIFPVGAVFSLAINNIGFHFKFWIFTPIMPNNESISALPLDLGLYPVLACFMIKSIMTNRSMAALIMFLFILFTTLLEFTGLLFGKVFYSNHWNIGFTFLSYVIAFGGVFLYFKLLERFRLL
ncbi:hypothetical protein L1N85_15945 [Paenibacillus alkaliterrae]|uniref:CBO0543 family protein n=1 Tax=Paenibacillus alkaliterrae TaxID=320909 RepID=UPI001F411F01|nr:CBO0543 family protein [Paenibacillus alkaliterrae]MCF2939909.1 hypothetical protein [Paenibacillus alkaliterrae]